MLRRRSTVNQLFSFGQDARISSAPTVYFKGARIGNAPTFYLLIYFLLIMVACQPSKQETNVVDEMPEEVVEETPEPIVTGKPDTDSRNKATVNDEPLWAKSELETQILYCVDLQLYLEEIDHYKFCKCFLEKARYSHEIDYLQMAYEEQQGWYEDCVEGSLKEY